MSSFQRFLIYAGHLIENFDNMLYGFFAVFLMKIFYPADISGDTASVFSFATFFMGFVSKPFGAFFWGRISDRFGRRIPLMFSMGLMGVPTLVIGLMPTYEDIGVIAPFILIFCRVLQGFFIGGEFSSAAIYMIESGDKKSQGARIYDLIGTGVIGAIIATLIGSLVMMDAAPAWAWRIPFIFGGISALIIFVLRRSIHETDEFKKSMESGVKIVSLKELLRLERLGLFISACLVFGISAVSLYLATVYGNLVYNQLGFSHSNSLLINTYALVLSAVTVVAVGRISSRFDYYQIIVFGLISSILAGFIAFYVVSMPDAGVFHVFFYVSMLSIFGSINVGAFYPYFANLFSVRERHTAIGMVSTIGPSIISGITPTAARLMVIYFDGNLFAPFYWIFLVYSVALFAVFYVQKFFYEKII